jgi:DNA-binding NarL/FixJ family response regulator/anti-sigma regulatory factor (Ser/Thr protein kinase)
VRSLEALVELNRRVNAGCEFELEVEDGFLELVPQDSARELVRIVQEALTNVRRHTGAQRVRVHAGASGDVLWFEVADDGRGFDREEISAGLGTRGMNQRARALGGELQVRSQPGKGTTVRFELRAGDEFQQPAAPPVERVRVLLVDDHAAFRQGVAYAMEQQPGLDVVGEAASLREARGVLAAQSVYVGILDLGLADGYGGDLIRELRSANPQAQALVLSATEDRLDLARAVEAGAAGIIHKSAAMKEIVDTVRRLQAGEQILPLEEVVELLRFAGARREQKFEVRQRRSSPTGR